MTKDQLRLILRRDEQPAAYDPLPFRNRILITGANGTLGEGLIPLLDEMGAEVLATDKDSLDVTDERAVERQMHAFRPGLVFHLAAQKHAPWGEEVPLQTMITNTIGTHNICAHRLRATIILASTCKAIQPETAYGASKLLAERIVLNPPVNGVVVRLFNVVPASGNVFELWEGMGSPVPVTNCWRYFISQHEAACALLAAACRIQGRYSPNPGNPRHMPAVAADLEYDSYDIPPRRGDRLVEPLSGICETAYPDGDLYRIVSQHDATHDRTDSIFEWQP